MNILDDQPGADSDDDTSRRRAMAAGFGLAIVVVTYGANGFNASGRQWAAAATILVAVLVADALVAVRRLLPTPGSAPLTLVAVLVAAYLCVPETDQFPIAGIIPVAVVAMEVAQRRQVGIEWYALAAASIGWGAMFGATGRQSALVGALFVWWAVALLPVVHLVRPVRSTNAALAVAGVGAIAAVVMARTGGIAATAQPAWLSVVIIAPASLAIALAIGVAATRLQSAPGDDTAA